MASLGSTFRTDEPDLSKMLEQIHTGRLQLPDFQRGWVWDDNHIRSLIASVSKSYPIGAVMVLENGGEGVRFKPRPIEGAPNNGIEPEALILDGQQRMTSLYLALRSGKSVDTRTEKGKDIRRIYYLDIASCLDEDIDREDAVISLPPDRVIRTNFNRDIVCDVSSIDKEYDQGYFPLSVLFRPNDYSQWRRGYQRHFRKDDARLDIFDKFEEAVLEAIKRYRVPAIELTRDTNKEAVCQVFEKVNTGGVSLTVFELMTATFAADDFDLRKDWVKRAEGLHENHLLRSLRSTEFLQAVTLLASFERNKLKGTPISCKRRDILNLTLQEYRDHSERIQEGIFKSAKLLIREKIYNDTNLPYQAQLVPLSAICAVLGKRFENDTIKQKLLRWYWCGVFGELYGGSNETRYANDLPDVIIWIDGGKEPRSIRDANFAPTRLLSLQTRQSAAYKGVMSLLMKKGSEDFINGDPIELTTFFDQAVDIHHVFPRKYCKSKGFARQKWNSVINKAFLTARTNRIIGGRAPSSYLKRIEREKDISHGRIVEILSSHMITASLLRKDDFGAFVVDRAKQLLDLIEEAMGKTVTGRDAEDVLKAYGEALTSHK